MTQQTIKAIILILTILTTLPTAAQEMTVKSMTLDVTDVTGTLNENLVQDNNDQYGGLVRVYLAAPSATFEGLVLRQQQHNASEYWVVMAKNSYRLKVVAPGYIPVEVNFRDYGIKGIESRRTYVLTILLPQTVSTLQNSATPIVPSTSVSTGAKENFTVNGVSFTMIRVDGGTFKMGSDDRSARKNESPVHEVTLSTYMIGKTEVTQALWQAVMGSNPSKYSGKEKCPVEMVSWNDCQEFIKKLNILTGRTFRLPTEAEWEFAARGGNKSNGYQYSGSYKIDDVAWYYDISNGKPHPVAKKSANELGLYDMSGNVLEWCSDWYGDYSGSSQTNPQGPSSGTYRVLRGGFFDGGIWNCRSASRDSSSPDSRYYYVGLRLAL